MKYSGIEGACSCTGIFASLALGTWTCPRCTPNKEANTCSFSGSEPMHIQWLLSARIGNVLIQVYLVYLVVKLYYF